MTADSSFEDLVQYNDGFRTQLIGTPEQITERVAAYPNVLPLVREFEESEPDSVGEPVLVSA